jgi:hypothetical protein
VRVPASSLATFGLEPAEVMAPVGAASADLAPFGQEARGQQRTLGEAAPGRSWSALFPYNYIESNRIVYIDNSYECESPFGRQKTKLGCVSAVVKVY